MEKPSAPEQMKMINTLYAVLFGLIILILIPVSLYVSRSGSLLQPHPELFAYLYGAAMLVAAVLLILAFWIPKRKMGKIDPADSLDNKLRQYRKATTLRLVLTADAALATLAFFLLTGDTQLILVVSIVLIFFIMSRPTPFKAASEMGLSEQEKEQILS